MYDIQLKQSVCTDLLNLLSRIPVLTVNQLIKWMHESKYNLDKDNALTILSLLVKDYQIIIFANHYVTTPELLPLVSVDRISVNTLSHKELCAMNLNVPEKWDCYLSMFWFILDQLPNSADFSLAYSPLYQINYLDREHGIFCELAYIKHDMVEATCSYLRSEEAHNPDADHRASFRRFAVVEKPEDADRLAGYGFSHALIISPKGRLSTAKMFPPETRWENIPDYE